MKGALLAMLGAGIVGAVVIHEQAAKAASVPPRRETRGRSGTVWFTQTAASDGAAHTRTNVFGSRTGNDLVLIYEQTGSDKKTRKLVFAAPSSNAATAKADFIG